MTKEKLIKKYKINSDFLDELEKTYNYYYNNELIQRMREIPMHRGSNCFLHSFKVAKKATIYCLKSNLRDKSKIVLEAAILHDYYLYDWRKNRELLKHHTKLHPSIANENAIKDFDISPEVSHIILTHMWPGNIKEVPKSKEECLVIYCDKHVALVESCSSIAYKKKRTEKYERIVSKLFD